MIKVIINGIEMEVVGVRKDRMLCECVGKNIRKSSFKIYKSRKDYFVNGVKRVYINEQLKELLGQWFKEEQCK